MVYKGPRLGGLMIETLKTHKINGCIRLMVQKSGVHQLRLLVEIPLFTRVLAPSQVVIAGFRNHQLYYLSLVLLVRELGHE